MDKLNSASNIRKTILSDTAAISEFDRPPADLGTPVAQAPISPSPGRKPVKPVIGTAVISSSSSTDEVAHKALDENLDKTNLLDSKAGIFVQAPESLTGEASSENLLHFLFRQRQLDYFCFPAVAADMDPRFIDYFMRPQNGVSVVNGRVDHAVGFPHQDNVVVAGPRGIGKTGKRLRLQWDMNQKFADDEHSRILVVPFLFHPTLLSGNTNQITHQGPHQGLDQRIAQPVMFAALLNATIRAAFAMLCQHGHLMDADHGLLGNTDILNALRQRFDMAYKPEQWRDALKDAIEQNSQNSQNSLVPILDEAGFPHEHDHDEAAPNRDWLEQWFGQLNTPAEPEMQSATPIPHTAASDTGETMRAFWLETIDLLLSIGFCRVLIMADGFESLGASSARCAAACVQQLAAHLVDTPEHGSLLALQAFVPDEVVANLAADILPKRYQLQAWPKTDLQLLIEKRLQVASHGLVHRIEQVCDLGIDVDELVEKAKGLPIRLLQDLERAFEQWAERTLRLDWT